MRHIDFDYLFSFISVKMAFYSSKTKVEVERAANKRRKHGAVTKRRIHLFYKALILYVCMVITHYVYLFNSF